MPSELVDRDSEHLRVLSILQYAAAAVTALVGCFPLIHVTIGAFLAFMPDSMRGTGKDAFHREAGLFFMAFGLAFIAAAWSMAAAHFLTARFLKQKRYFGFCVGVSFVTCFACMFSSALASSVSRR